MTGTEALSDVPTTFTIGGDLPVRRLGFGSMRIAGRGVWGEPTDREGVLRTLKRAVELGVNFIDTADSYGPFVSEQLIREALHPYPGVVVATKAGLTRPGPDQWAPRGDPDYLIAEARGSRERLGVERIDLWQLHRIDPTVPRLEQFQAIRALLDAGVIRHAGLSEVSVEEIEAAREIFPVSTVQNRYNLADRSSEAVLDYCTANGIGFIPWYPLAAGRLTAKDSVLSRIAAGLGANPGQIALAWLLRRSPVVLPIPGTSQVAHLEENVRAASITLSAEDFAVLDRAGRDE
ncbi:aryl-alcohol dehydrogenase-like predicted oxidoreductase [Brevundimonas vesicularis]|uniref:Aryl-alcohol dehydrogenase-like predicted oxidoreductase n=1 Tax=Brevundimonas vesicularis TaxID=41276 RepID=A0A7W9FRG9_BREVE|nr:aldo/keto reductase [Brevundimonas vesicularis]MBB5770244.1 aryl-alcohol dehydrogenase-like predicted oxidoreductase [Brevundimonas vesicularis]